MRVVEKGDEGGEMVVKVREGGVIGCRVIGWRVIRDGGIRRCGIIVDIRMMRRMGIYIMGRLVGGR